MATSYFVIGTDTGVGKTYIASALVQHFVGMGLKTVGMKPIASGGEYDKQGEYINDDVSALMQVSNINAPLELVNPYRFLPAIAPHIAATQAGVEMNLEVIVDAYQQLKTLAEMLIVEGAGGFLVPINQDETLADLAVTLNIPIILVVGMRLGCINHTLLTVEAIQARGLKLAGWVANEIDPEMAMFDENLDSLHLRVTAPCLAVARYQQEIQFDFK